MGWWECVNRQWIYHLTDGATIYYPGASACRVLMLAEDQLLSKSSNRWR
jgi:hypothetical protein